MSHLTEEANATVYEVLRQASPGPVSGQELARLLGVSRVSVKARLDQLRAEGFSIEAAPGRGYRLVSDPCVLHRIALAHELAQSASGIMWTLLAECESTNDEAMRRLMQGDVCPLVVISKGQTAGRGRQGRTWHSEDDGNLMLTFGFRPNRPAAGMQRFTVWLGLRLAAMLAREWGVPALAKWPNDLLLGGRKLAGILTEARLDADGMRELVVGLGLNVNSDPADWPAEVRNIATSLATHRGKPLPMNAVAASVVAEVVAAYDAYLAGKADRAAMDALWERFSAINHQSVSLQTPQGEVSGDVLGLDETSALRLRLSDGSERNYSSGDVTLSSVETTG